MIKEHIIATYNIYYLETFLKDYIKILQEENHKEIEINDYLERYEC